MNKWIKYNEECEQIDELFSNKFIVRNNLKENKFIMCATDFDNQKHLKEWLAINNITHYLICKPHPLAHMIKRHADTNQPIWKREIGTTGAGYVVWIIHNDLDRFEYSFTPFEGDL